MSYIKHMWKSPSLHHVVYGLLGFTWMSVLPPGQSISPQKDTGWWQNSHALFYKPQQFIVWLYYMHSAGLTQLCAQGSQGNTHNTHCPCCCSTTTAKTMNEDWLMFCCWWYNIHSIELIYQKIDEGLLSVTLVTSQWMSIGLLLLLDDHP